MRIEMSQRNWNRNVIFLTLITQIKMITTAVDIIPAVHFEYAKCEHVTVNGYLTAKCANFIENENKDQDHYLPGDLQQNIQVLDLIPKDSTEYVRFDFLPEDFQRYPNLKRILIRRLRSSTFRTPETILTAYSTCFKDSKTLQHIEFTHSNLSEEYTIAWPKGLKVLKLDNNKFQKLEIKECKALQELSANDNLLQDIPTFYHKNIPLRTLHLKRNPLDNMTILGIAPLCELSVLELEFPSGSHYSQKNSIVSYCDCEMLKKWSKQNGISGPENITCNEPKKKLDSCSEEILEEAKHLHKGCPILKSHRSLPILKILEVVLFLIFFLIFVSAVTLYVIRYFHLKEKLTGRRGPVADDPSVSNDSEIEDRTSDYE